MVEGEIQGKTKLFIELLEKRFQSLSSEQKKIVLSIKSEVIFSAIEYLFQADSLDEMFGYIDEIGVEDQN